MRTPSQWPPRAPARGPSASPLPPRRSQRSSCGAPPSCSATASERAGSCSEAASAEEAAVQRRRWGAAASSLAPCECLPSLSREERLLRRPQPLEEPSGASCQQRLRPSAQEEAPAVFIRFRIQQEHRVVSERRRTGRRSTTGSERGPVGGTRLLALLLGLRRRLLLLDLRHVIGTAKDVVVALLLLFVGSFLSSTRCREVEFASHCGRRAHGGSGRGTTGATC